MHDLRVEEFYTGRAQGWVKTFSLRGIKDSPPYLHDGRLPTLEDTVEFFNLVFDLKLSKSEKQDLVAFMRARCDAPAVPQLRIQPCCVPVGRSR